MPSITVTDTPVARETDYGRVDDHSSAIRADGDARRTYNRVPDYPVPGATVSGAWTGGRMTASSSSSDATAMPDVAPATSPAAAIDGDRRPAWVSNGLQSAVGQWLRVDFDHPVTNGVVTITPSATAGPRPGPPDRDRDCHRHHHPAVRRARPARRPRRCRTAKPRGCADHRRRDRRRLGRGAAPASPDLSITQYDASGFAHPVGLRHTAQVPGPPPGSAIAGWDLGSDCSAGRAVPGRQTACAARRRWRWRRRSRSTSAAR